MTYPTLPAKPQDNLSAARGVFHGLLAGLTLLYVGTILTLLIGLKATLIFAGVALTVIALLMWLFFTVQDALDDDGEIAE